MKVTITENEIEVEIGGRELPISRGPGALRGWSCRLAAIEACSWAIRRLGEEMKKSMAFHRTGKITDRITLK
jgi:hypothetical protein